MPKPQRLTRPNPTTLSDVRTNTQILLNNFTKSKGTEEATPSKDDILKERSQWFNKGMTRLKTDHRLRRIAFDKAAEDAKKLARVELDKELLQEMAAYKANFDEAWPLDLG